MSRYTRTPTQRRADQARIARQEASMRALARELHGGCLQPPAAPVEEPTKQQRRDRLEQKRLHRQPRPDKSEQS